MILILDLDDTIFPAKTLDYSIFDNAKNIIESFTHDAFGPTKSAMIIEEVKLIPFDIVAQKYNFPKAIIHAFQKEIDSIDYQLDIRVFEDYHYLKNLEVEKYLVTAGFSRLQKAKINALEIESDFKDIFIDDPFDPNRKFKQHFF
jgi:putative hydrolase of the HAD superfamily